MGLIDWLFAGVERRLNARLDQLTAAVTAAQQREVMDMATMQEAIKKLQDDVTAETTVIDSAVTLLNQIPDLIRNAAGDPAALEQLASTIEANSAGLANAVAANTPAVPTP